MTMLNLDLFVKDMSDFFVELDNRFQILEDYLNFSCYSQCNSYRQDAL